MPISIQRVPYGNELGSLVESSTVRLRVCSPYITQSGFRYLLKSGVAPQIITRATASNIQSNALEPDCLRQAIAFGAEVRSIANLHAKIYLMDFREGIVTSSNLTGSGLLRNVELGVHFIDEPQFFGEVDDFFNQIWARASVVTEQALDELVAQTSKLVSHRGIFRDPELSTESLVPIPTIGYIVEVPNQQVDDIQTHLHDESSHSDPAFAPSPDEFGDLYWPIPESSDEIILELKSDDQDRAQAILNTINTMAPESLTERLRSFTPEDRGKLLSIESHYPYKRWVLRRIIRDADPHLLGELIEYLAASPSNEVQLNLYLSDVLGVCDRMPPTAKSIVLESITNAGRKLEPYLNGGVDSDKNFARPNLDNLEQLAHRLGATIQFAKPEMDLPSNGEIASDIPGFQEIKRRRESLGQGFWMYAEGLFPQIENGDWNTALPSLASLLRELRKIQLQPHQKLRVNNLALTAERGLYEEVRGRLQRTTSAAQSIQGRFSPELPSNMVSVWERGIQDLTEGLESTQLMYSTGRLIQSYGQLLKSAHIAPDRSFKRDLDYLTTFVTIRKLFREWNR